MIQAGKKAALLSTLNNRSNDPESVDFDGDSDYLGRTTNLIDNNSDSNTFTFSGWFYANDFDSDGGGVCYFMTYDAPNIAFWVQLTNGDIQIIGNQPGSPAATFSMTYPGSGQFAINTWYHFVCSIDLSNTSRRHLFINDEDVTSSVTWSTYINTNINFTGTAYSVARLAYANSYYFHGRAAHVFLDYTYRDLTVEENRRNFITADLKPADGQDSLSPIIYLPITDATAAGTNLGTGGDFTVNGTITQSGRGPNQFKIAGSYFDGSNDRLERSSLTGTTDVKTMTASVWAKLSSGGDVVSSNQGAITIQISPDDTFGLVRVTALQSATTQLQIRAPYFDLPFNEWIHVAVSVDMSDPAKRHLVINGVAVTPVVTTYNDSTLDWTGVQYYVNRGGTQVTGDIAEYWLDDSYMDLSVNNPFYDSDINGPKDLGIDGSKPTGSPPLVYLPLRGDDAGSNKGTAGDFTVTSGPFTGSRSPLEYWAHSAEFAKTSSQDLAKPSILTGITDNDEISVVMGFYPIQSIQQYLMVFRDEASGGIPIYDLLANGTTLEITGRESPTNLTKLSDAFASSINIGQWNILMSSTKYSTSSHHLYMNGESGGGASIINNSHTFQWSSAVDNIYIGSQGNAGTFGINGRIGFVWMDNTYIDFSQEANRLKFVDAFLNPINIGEDGSEPTGSAPLIYMNENIHLGTNLGTGGNFTPRNAPINGGYVKG